MFTPFAFIKRQVSAAIAAIGQRILLAGPFNTFNTTVVTNGVKLKNSNSEIDTTFNVGSGPNSTVYASAFNENNKLIIGGAFTSYSGSSSPRLVRINTDGTRDTTFNVGSGSDNIVYTVLPVSGSKVLIGGSFTAYSSSAVNYITRANANGTLDTTFKGDTNGDVYTSATQSDGKVIIGGNFTSLGYTTPQIIKLTPQGVPDYTFNQGIGFGGNTVLNSTTQSDGKIIAVGSFTGYSGSTSPYIVRINTDGTKDTSFNPGTGFIAETDVVRVQPDGKLLVGGNFTSYSGSTVNKIVRINPDGTRDTSFNIGTGFSNGIVYDIQLQSDNKIIVVGSFSGTYSGSAGALRAVRLNNSGSRDTTFNIGTTGFGTGPQYSAQIQNDGKIIVVGTNATYSGSAGQRIRRINTNGTLDTTFNIGTAGINNTGYRAKIQPDQKILVTGLFTVYSGSTAGVVNRIVRINPDGTRDTTFIQGGGFPALTSIQSALELDSSGNIYVGGNFTSYSGSSVNFIVKINPSGSINTGIKTGGNDGVNSTVNTLVVDSTQNVYAIGIFGAYNSLTYRIARLNTDGGKDYTFNPNAGGFTGGSGAVYSLKVQPDDKIVVGGAFTTYNSGSVAIATNKIARINTDGSYDTSFNIATGFGNNVYKIALENTGKVLALGLFTSYSGSSVNFLARLNASGSLDSTFSTNTYFPADSQNCDLLVDNSGSIHVVPSTGYSAGYSKLTSSGSYDYNTIITDNTSLHSLTADNSGNVTMLGTNFSASMNTSTGIIAFNNSSNTTSSLFNPGTGFFRTSRTNTYGSTPNVSTKTPSGDIWLGGSFVMYSGSNVSDGNGTGVIKINQQGNLIAVATSSQAVFTGGIYSLQLQSDGKLLVGIDGNGYYQNPVRVNSNGSPDTSFTPIEWLGTIDTMQVQSTGKVLIGGNFGYPISDGEGGFSQGSPFYFVRLNSSGSIDNTFPNSPTNSYVFTINTLSNDSSILTGAFTTYATTSSNYIAKINSEGVLDTSFNVGAGFGNIVYKSTLQSDGKLIAAGEFITYSGSTANRLARINTDGALDTTFNPGSGFNVFNSTSKIVVDTLGNIHIAGGGFTSYSGSAISGYVKILPNGNIDPTGTSGSFSVGQPYTIELLD